MTKVLIFSDLHCNVRAAKAFQEQSEQADLMIGAGDFANQHRGIEKCLDVLKQSSKPFVAVPGNNETLEALQHACLDWPLGFVLHGSGIEISGLRLFGIGGGIPVTPFGDWSYDFTEDEGRKLLSNGEQADILISHSPPKGHVDRTSTGQSVGSQSVLEWIENQNPQWVVCGHIHDSWQQESTLNGTRIINIGPKAQLIEVAPRS